MQDVPDTVLAPTSEIPAAKFVAVNEITRLQTAKLVTTIVNRVLSTALIIALVFAQSDGNTPLGLSRLGYAGLIIQLVWLSYEVATVTELRRAYSQLALVDAPRFSTDWQDKFVGVSNIYFLASVYRSIFEPVVWGLLFVVVAIEGPLFHFTQPSPYGREEAYDYLLDLAKRNDRPFDAEKLGSQFERNGLLMRLSTADLSGVHSMGELSVKYYGDAHYWPLIPWMNPSLKELPNIDQKSDPTTARGPLYIVRFLDLSRRR